MTKFKCVKSTSSSEHSPKVGDVIEGRIMHVKRGNKIEPRIDISKDSDRKGANGNPYFDKGESVPLEGGIWSWEEIK